MMMTGFDRPTASKIISTSLVSHPKLIILLDKVLFPRTILFHG